MEITIDKSKLILEKSGNNSFYLTGEGASQSLTAQSYFEGVTGFNEKYISPLFRLFASDCEFYKCFRVTGKDKYGESKQITYFHISNIRQTSFLFATLKSLSISLSGLRLGYHTDKDGKDTIYVHSKIINTLKHLEEDNKVQLAIYLYSLVKFFKAIYINDVEFTASTAVNGEEFPALDKDKLEAIYKTYEGLDEVTTINCEELDDNMVFDSVVYVSNHTTTPAKLLIKPVSACDFKYNYLKDDKNESLIIINNSFSPKLFYRILDRTVYTNCELAMYNTFDISEWIPGLVANMIKTLKISGNVNVVRLPLEKILSTSAKEISILTEVSDEKYMALLEEYPNCCENTNMKLYEGYFKDAKVITENSLDSLKESYKDDEYAQKLYEQILPHFSTFNLKDLTGIVKGFAKGEVYSMLFEGDAGTGKSTAARVIPSRCGIPFVALNCSTNIEEADMFGTMIPNPEKKSADDPEFIWKDGPATKAIRNGYTLIIEEINFARPGILGKLNSLLDESRQIDLPNGEVLKAHPNFRVIATCNIAYDGTNRLNKALIDRFEICKKFEDLDQKEAIEIIKERTGYKDTLKLEAVFCVYNAIKKYSNEQNLNLIVSLRRLLTIFTIGKYYKTAKDALNSLILNQAFLEEPEHFKYFKESVLTAFDLSFKI